MKSALILGVLFAVSFNSFAGILALQPGTKEIEGVKVAQTGVLSLQGQQINVSPICAGLRWKPVLVAKPKVYVLQILATDASKFIRTEAKAISSLDESRSYVFHLSFLRNVDAATIQKSYRYGFTANNVTVSSSHIDSFLKAASQAGDSDNGSTMVIAVQKNADGTETVSYEDGKAKLAEVSGPKGFGVQIAALWLGISADAGLADFKAKCLAP